MNAIEELSHFPASQVTDTLEYSEVLSCAYSVIQDPVNVPNH